MCFNLNTLIKSNPLVISTLLENIDLLLTNEYKNNLINNYDLSKSFLSSEDKEKYIAERINEFKSYDFKTLKSDIKEMSKNGGKEIFTSTINKVTSELKSNVNQILNDVSNGNIETLKEISNNNIRNLEKTSMELLKNKLKEMEDKINNKIFPLIVDAISLLEKNDLEKIRDSFNLKKQIDDEKDLEIKKSKKISFIKNYIKEDIDFNNISSDEIETLYIKRNINLDSDFYLNMKNINKIKRIKEIFGDFFNTENIKKIMEGKRDFILYKLVYKLSSDVIISNILKIQTDSSYLIKNANKRNQTFEKDIIAKVSEIKSTGIFEQDYACALIINEIKTALEIKDLTIARKIQKDLKSNQEIISKNIEGISEISIENTENIINNSIEEVEKKINETIDGYKEIYNNFNNFVNEKIVSITNIDKNIENINKNINNIDSLSIENKNNLLEIIKNQKEVLEKREEKIKNLEKIAEEIKNKINNMENKKINYGNKDIEIISNEISKENILLKSINDEIEKETSITNTIKNFLNKDVIKNINEISETEEKYIKEFSSIKEEIKTIKEISNLDKGIDIVKTLKTKVKTDIETIEKIPEKLKEKSKEIIKDVLKYDNFKEIGNQILNMFNISKDIKNYNSSKNYLRIVSTTIKDYGYKSSLDEYFNEMSEIAIKKIEIFRKLDILTKSLSYFEKVIRMTPKEVLKNNTKEDILKKYGLLLNRIEETKMELLNYLSLKNNKSINENMFNIDNEFKDFLFDSKNIKEIRMMSIISKGTNDNQPQITKETQDKLKFIKEEEEKLRKRKKIQINMSDLKNQGLEINLEKNKNFSLQFNKGFFNNIKNVISKVYEFDDKEYNGKTEYYTEYLSLNNNSFFTIKDERTGKYIDGDEESIYKRMETIKNDKMETIKSEDIQTDLSMLTSVSELNYVNINYLNKIENVIDKLINAEITKETLNPNIKKETQEENNYEYFKEYFLETFIINKDDKYSVEILENLLNELKTTKVTTKKELINIVNEKIKNLFIDGKIRFNKKEFSYEDKKMFLSDNNINLLLKNKNNEDFKTNFINKIINNDFFMKKLNKTQKENLFKSLMKSVTEILNITNTNNNVTNDKIKSSLTTSINNYVQKNLVKNNQALLIDNDIVLNKILSNNVNHSKSDSYSINKILELDDILSTKLKELYILFSLKKQTNSFDDKEENILKNNISKMKLLYFKIKSNYLCHFNKKELNQYTNLEKYVSNIKNQSKVDLFIDYLNNRNNEKLYMINNETVINTNQETKNFKQYLKELEKNDNSNVNKIIDFYLKYDGKDISNEIKNISILIFSSKSKKNNNKIEEENYKQDLKEMKTINAITSINIDDNKNKTVIKETKLKKLKEIKEKLKSPELIKIIEILIDSVTIMNEDDFNKKLNDILNLEEKINEVFVKPQKSLVLENQ